MPFSKHWISIFLRFVLDIFKEDGKCKNLNVICKIPLMVPKVIVIVMFDLSFLIIRIFL